MRREPGARCGVASLKFRVGPTPHCLDAARNRWRMKARRDRRCHAREAGALAMTRRRIALLVVGLFVIAGALAAPAVHEWWEAREEAVV